MCEACKSDFNTVGDSPLSFVGTGAAQRSSYGKSTKKNVMGTGSSPTGTTGMPKNVKLPETGGPSFTPTATLYKANAAEASATQRNVKIMPSKAGVGDFWAARARGGN